MKALTLFAAALLAACSGPAPETSSDGNMTSVGSVERKVAAPKPAAPNYIGRWIGVEGMVLDIATTGSPGHYTLTMQWDLDNKGKFAGTANRDTISFDRDGVRETMRHTNGEATGLKYLAGKSDCLTVKTGEGYCRD